MTKHRWLILLFVTFACIYFWQIFSIPSDQASLARYQLTHRNTQMLRLSVSIPVIIVWVVALYGYFRLDRYADLLRKTKEYPIWKNISRGLFVMALYFPASSICSNASSFIYHNNPALTPRMVILNNYFILSFLSVSTLYIFRGARRLYYGPQVKRGEWPYGPLYLLIVLLIGSFFAYINLSNPARQFPTTYVPVAAYYLPDWLLVFTILIPYISIWFLGAKSVEYIHAYRRYVSGKIYKSSLRSLAIGLATVVLAWFAMRFLAATTTTLDKVGLKYLLILVYTLLFMIGFGFTMIARGASKLAKIEEA